MTLLTSFKKNKQCPKFKNEKLFTSVKKSAVPQIQKWKRQEEKIVKGSKPLSELLSISTKASQKFVTVHLSQAS